MADIARRISERRKEPMLEEFTRSLGQGQCGRMHSPRFRRVSEENESQCKVSEFPHAGAITRDGK